MPVNSTAPAHGEQRYMALKGLRIIKSSHWLCTYFVQVILLGSWQTNKKQTNTFFLFSKNLQNKILLPIVQFRKARLLKLKHLPKTSELKGLGHGSSTPKSYFIVLSSGQTLCISFPAVLPSTPAESVVIWYSFSCLLSQISSLAHCRGHDNLGGLILTFSEREWHGGGTGLI